MSAINFVENRVLRQRTLCILLKGYTPKFIMGYGWGTGVGGLSGPGPTLTAARELILQMFVDCLDQDPP